MNPVPEIIQRVITDRKRLLVSHSPSTYFNPVAKLRSHEQGPYTKEKIGRRGQLCLRFSGKGGCGAYSEIAKSPHCCALAATTSNLGGARQARCARWANGGGGAGLDVSAARRRHAVSSATRDSPVHRALARFSLRARGLSRRAARVRASARAISAVVRRAAHHRERSVGAADTQSPPRPPPFCPARTAPPVSPAQV